MGPEALSKPEINDFLRRPLYACCATINKDGSPHLTYVWYTWDGATFRFSTTKERVKYRNLSRDPRVSMAMPDSADPYRYVVIRGKVSITEDYPSDFIVEESIRYLGQEKGRPYGESMRKEQRVIVQMKPEKVTLVGF